MNVLEYRGYRARVEFDAEDGLFFGKVAGIRDGVTFHGDSVEGLRESFREAVDDYVGLCERIGNSPQKPYSGQIMVRVDPDIHAKAALAAELAGKSLAKWTEQLLKEGADKALVGA